MDTCLHNTLNVSHFDTYVLPLKDSESLLFSNLEGVVETITKAVLNLLFTLDTDTKIFSPWFNLNNKYFY